LIFCMIKSSRTPEPHKPENSSEVTLPSPLKVLAQRITTIAVMAGLAYSFLKEFAVNNSTSTTPVLPEVQKKPETVQSLSRAESLALQYLLREQAQAKVPVDGIIGAETIALCAEHMQQKGTVSPSFGLDSRGPLVAMTQGMLKDLGFYKATNVDGHLGPISQESIKSFQLKYELNQSGEIDFPTLSKLLEVEKSGVINYYFDYIVREAGAGKPSQGGGNCGQGVCALLLKHPDPRVRKVADRAAKDPNGEAFYPREGGKRDAVKIDAYLKHLSQLPGSGWIEVPIKSLDDIKSGAIMCYPSLTGRYIYGSGDGSAMYGHIAAIRDCEVTEDTPYGIEEHYDLKTGKPGGRRETFKRGLKYMAEGKASVYYFVGDRLSYGEESTQQELILAETKVETDGEQQVEVVQKTAPKEEEVAKGKLAEEKQVVAKEENVQKYTVKKNDTVFGILKEFGIQPSPQNLEKFRVQNRLSKDFEITPGKSLTIPNI
jgi:hypothetical protein